jgi:hypothetical protein
MRRVGKRTLLLASALSWVGSAPVAYADSVSTAPPPQERTDFGFTEWRFRSLTPLSRAVAGVGTDFLWSMGGGWWRDWFRLGVAVGLGFAADCSLCSPFSPFRAVLLEGHAGFNVLSDPMWEVWLEAGYGWLAASRDSGGTHFQALQGRGSVWRRLSQRRPIVSVAISFDAYAEAWLGPDGGAPAAGLGVGVVAPF